MPTERRTERRRQVDALRLASRERRRQAVERQVVQAHVAQESQTLADFLQHLLGDGLFLFRELEAAEKRLRLADREGRHLVDRAVGHLHGARFAPQPRPAAVRAREIPAIAAEKDADVHLVFLLVEPAEEAANAFVVVVAVDDEAPLLVGQLPPRDVEGNLRLARDALQFGELRAIVRLAPGLDGVLRDRLLRIGHDQIHVELDDVAEPVAGRARAERVVEREQPRLRVFVADAARTALESLGKQMHDWWLGGGGWRLGGWWLVTGGLAIATPPRRLRDTPSRSSP